MDSFRQQHIIDYILGARDTKIIKASSGSVGCNSPGGHRHADIDALMLADVTETTAQGGLNSTGN